MKQGPAISGTMTNLEVQIALMTNLSADRSLSLVNRGHRQNFLDHLVVGGWWVVVCVHFGVVFIFEVVLKFEVVFTYTSHPTAKPLWWRFIEQNRATPRKLL